MWQEQPTAIHGIPVYGKRFAVYPGAKGRSTHGGFGNTTARLVDTGHIRANYIRQFNVEVARQWGPLIIDAEYSDAYVHRIGNIQGALSFSGWNVQGRYMLTGESHAYDVAAGNFCSFIPCNIYGAVELAARYDFVNLNSKNLLGGTEHNASVGINWYINDNTRFSLNYIRANIHPGTAAALAVNAVPNTVQRYLDIVAFRAAFRF
jgi:phosphate-selective porin OprO/OprP